MAPSPHSLLSLRGSNRLSHRADVGMVVLRAHWGNGIGTAILDAAGKLSRKMGLRQLELEVVAENTGALSLYRKAGFVEYGRNPRGMLMESGEYREMVEMRLELQFHHRLLAPWNPPCGKQGG